MTTPRIPKLPVELLTNIVSHFCLHCQVPGLEFHKDGNTCSSFTPEGYEQLEYSYKTLLAFCKVSKGFCAIAQPMLYHFVFIHSFDFKPLLRVIQTVLSKPDLASHIRWVQINVVGTFDRLRGDVAPAEITPELAHQLSAAARKYDLYPPPEWQTKTDSTQDDEKMQTRIVIETLLLHARNLETLHLTVDDELGWAFGNGDTAIPDGNNAAQSPDSQVAKKPAYSPTFKRLMLDYYDDEGGLRLSEMPYLLELAPFDSLMVRKCVDWLPIPPPEGQVWSSVSHLNLKHSLLELDEVVDIVRACSRLESFTLFTWSDHTHDPVELYGNDEEEPGNISRLLQTLAQHHGPSLRSLWLEFAATEGRYVDDNENWTNGPEPDTDDLISTLKNFSVLEELYLDFRHVFAATQPRLVDVLPASIKRLEVVNKIGTIEQDLYELADAVDKEEFPSLREVSPLIPRVLKPSGAGDGKYVSVSSSEALEIMDRLCVRFTEVGVKLTAPNIERD